MKSKRKGSIAVGEAVVYFIAKGMTVLISISDCDKYDLVNDDNGSLKRIQCKYSSSLEPSGAYIVDLSTYGGYRNKTYYTKYNQGDFDLLFVYCSNRDKYLNPAGDVIGRSKISVGKKSWRQHLLAGLAE